MSWLSELSHYLQCRHPKCATVPHLVVLLPIQLPANACKKAIEKGPSAWALELTWEAWKKLLTSGFGLANPWSLQPLRE